MKARITLGEIPKTITKSRSFGPAFLWETIKQNKNFPKKKKGSTGLDGFNGNHPLVSIGKGRALRIQNGNLALQDQDSRLAANTSDFERTDIDQGGGIEIIQYGYNYRKDDENNVIRLLKFNRWSWIRLSFSRTLCAENPPQKKDFLFWDLDFFFERLIKRSLSKSSVSRKTRELVSIEVQQIEQSWGFAFPKKSCRWRVKHHSFCALKKGENLEDMTSVLKKLLFAWKLLCIWTTWIQL